MTVQIGDGDAQESFPVHKDLLTACSPYFKAAFDGQFREATDKTIPIPDVTPTQFRLFLDWLYFRKLPKKQQIDMGEDGCLNYKSSGKTCEESRKTAGFTEDYDFYKVVPFQEFTPITDEVDQHLESLIATGPWEQHMLYVFGDRCDVPALRQDLIDKMSKQNCSYFAEVIYTMRHLSTKSPLIKLILDQYATRYNFSRILGDDVCGTEVLLRQKLPLEFVWVLFYRNMSQAKDEKLLCAYHEHDQDEETIRECQGKMDVDED